MCQEKLRSKAMFRGPTFECSGVFDDVSEESCAGESEEPGEGPPAAQEMNWDDGEVKDRGRFEGSGATYSSGSSMPYDSYMMDHDGRYVHLQDLLLAEAVFWSSSTGHRRRQQVPCSILCKGQSQAFVV